jgi:hypothetical protein
VGQPKRRQQSFSKTLEPVPEMTIRTTLIVIVLEKTIKPEAKWVKDMF